MPAVTNISLFVSLLNVDHGSKDVYVFFLQIHQGKHKAPKAAGVITLSQQARKEQEAGLQRFEAFLAKGEPTAAEAAAAVQFLSSLEQQKFSEIGGRWSQETCTFLRLLASHRTNPTNPRASGVQSSPAPLVCHADSRSSYCLRSIPGRQ